MGCRDKNLDMNSQEIKQRRDELLLQIESAEKALKELRDSCPHENIIDTNWSWRIGCIDPAEVCDDCGKLIKIKTF